MGGELLAETAKNGQPSKGGLAGIGKTKRPVMSQRSTPKRMTFRSGEELGRELGPAPWQTRKMKERGLLRCSFRETVARMVRGC